MGDLNVAPSNEALSYFVSLIDDETDARWTLIIDLSKLQQYAAEVRSVWQDALLGRRDRFERIYWVTQNPLFRMVAAGVCLFAGISCSVVAAPRDIEAKLKLKPPIDYC